LRLAKDSTAWISVPIFITALLAAVGNWYASTVALVGSLFIIFFHRDPDRAPDGDGMLSPADGRVLPAERNKVAVFMGPWDVHVNRAPLDGLVKGVQHLKGGHAPAFLGAASRNDQSRIFLETRYGEIEIRQISGSLVRDIICYVQPGDRVSRGERIGMVRFGSRVEVTIPEDFEICVENGGKVHAGESIIAVKSG
jgi:phosphatidylserine decarboxylase